MCLRRAAGGALVRGVRCLDCNRQEPTTGEERRYENRRRRRVGRVLIEAMACGVPVIGSRSGEIPHVIGQAGLTFTEGDVQELRARLSQLMDAPALRADLARRGRERVLAHYTQAKIAAETYEVYRQLLNRTE